MTSRDGTDDLEHPIVSRLYAGFDPIDRRTFGPHRRWLASGLAGRVVDLGAGDGATFPYVAEAVAASDEVEYHAVEPDSTMRSRARRRAADLDLTVTFHDARGEALPFDEGGVDVVLATLVFCTIEDPATALDEIARVLRPGGEFRFVEHVGGDGLNRRVQTALTPLWKRVAGGCHLDRDTGERFGDHDAFEVLELEQTNVRTYPAAPVIRGRLRRRGS